MWFSDREGIKVLVPSLRLQRQFGNLRTHIGCPKCQKERPDISHSVQVRHEGIVPVLSEGQYTRDWVVVRQKLR